jgi:hypothetical protein
MKIPRVPAHVLPIHTPPDIAFGQSIDLFADLIDGGRRLEFRGLSGQRNDRDQQSGKYQDFQLYSHCGRISLVAGESNVRIRFNVTLIGPDQPSREY